MIKHPFHMSLVGEVMGLCSPLLVSRQTHKQTDAYLTHRLRMLSF